jgi:ElaB/YqjD/DUF883 family membrane-anchored ribosome-binding protein
MATASDFARKTSAGVNDVQDDLRALKDDVSKLAQQVVNLASDKGSDAFRKAKKQISDTAGEATDAVRDVRDTFADAVEDSLKERPYTTLALAVGLGFILGAAWRR